jgi:exopolysaccharide production protein ExoQ
VSEWFGGSTVLGSPDQYLDGSPVDALIFASLELAAIIVLAGRSQRCRALLRANGPLLVFFLYCALSVVWSDYPLVAFKRWTKALGNVVMVLIVLTDPDPRAAVKRFLADTGFVMLPLSILLIKYYPTLGRGFDHWTGHAYNTGVGMDKNALGVICLIFGLGSLWRVLAMVQSRERPRPTRALIAHGLALAMALWLFTLADSATSRGGFLVGSAFIGLTSWRRVALKPMAVHVLAVVIVSVCLFGVLVDTDVGLVQAMGRDSTLTTRTQLWEDIMRVPVNPLVGTGFESFWLGDRAKSLWAKHWWHPNQAHNGYLEVFLNLGWLGVTLLGFLIVWGYGNVIRTLRRDPELGKLRLALLMAALLYNLTEAAFKVMHPVWIIFILAVMATPRAARPRPPESGGAEVPASSWRRTHVATTVARHRVADVLHGTQPEGEHPCRQRPTVEKQSANIFAPAGRSSDEQLTSATTPSSPPPM